MFYALIPSNYRLTLDSGEIITGMIIYSLIYAILQIIPPYSPINKIFWVMLMIDLLIIMVHPLVSRVQNQLEEYLPHWKFLSTGKSIVISEDLQKDMTKTLEIKNSDQKKNPPLEELDIDLLTEHEV